MQPLELVDTVSEVRSRRDTWLACVGVFFSSSQNVRQLHMLSGYVLFFLPMRDASFHTILDRPPNDLPSVVV